MISEAAIRDIAAHTPPPVATFLLTSLQTAAAIVAQQRRLAPTTLQLVDSVPLSAYAELRAALPGIRLVQVVHVTGPESLDDARGLAEHVDALLLDSGNPKLAVKELGGTGRRHDWSVSRAIREAVDVPIFLAGGLTPENVALAITEVGPFGLDVCSGVRSAGALDEQKLRAFFAAAG